MVAILGIVSFWSVFASLLMVVLGSAKRPEEWENLARFAMNSLSLIVASFAVLLALIVAPFNGLAGTLIVVASLVLGGVMYLAWRKDERIRRRMRKINANANTKSIENKTQSSEEKPATT